MDIKKRRWFWTKLNVSAAVFALIALGVFGMAWLNPIVREGNSADFWASASGVCIDGQYTHRAHRFEEYQPRDGWLIYADGRSTLVCGPLPVYRVREDVAFADFPEVVRHLNRPDLRDFFRDLDLSSWRKLDPDGTDPRLFLQEVCAHRLATLKARSLRAYQWHLESEAQVDELWWLAHNWRPVLVAAELVYFAVLASFALWPWWRSTAWP